MIFRTLRETCALLATVCLLVLGAARGAAADTMMLEWDQSSGSVGYRVHVGVESGSYTQHFDVGSATLFTFQTATAGQRYCFAVSAYLLSSLVEGPNSSEVCGYSNAPPTLVNPGNRTSTVGQNVTLQLVGSDPASQPLTYSATGLPPGLSLMDSTGFISGAGTTAGSYSVTVRAFDGVLTASQAFTWVMTAPTGDTTRPTSSISSPTSGTTYSTTSSTMSLGGSASDNVAVSQVRWASDRGPSGVASGTTNWSVSGIPLSSGSNVITITAFDAAGNQGTDALTVTYTVTSTDTTRPTASIATPTSGTSHSTTSSTMALGGTAADNVGVTQVRWSSDRGGSGVATGTTGWNASGIALQSGANVITVTALDAAGNQGTDSLTVTYSAPGGGGGGTGPDRTAPTVSITAPTTAATHTTSASMISIGGTAADNRGVTQIVWWDSNGRSGYPTPATTWSVSNIPLPNGTTTITVMVLDAASNHSSDTLTVTRSATAPPTTPSQPSPSSVGFMVEPRTSGRTRSARLIWSNAPWTSVDVYRNGLLVTNTENDNRYTDAIWNRGTYTYQICAAGSTTTCSNIATAYF